MFDLSGKKALVTGSSRGIGRGIALALAQQGADVVINYRSSQPEAEAVVAEIQKMGREAIAIQADVADPASIAQMFAQVKEKWALQPDFGELSRVAQGKQLDILVNNAGILQTKPFDEITVDDWDKMINTNLRSQFFCAQEAARLMAEGGRIINIASISSGGVGIAYPQIAHYTTAKGGVVGLTEALAIELGAKGINVNAIAPGAIETDMTKGILDNEQVMQGMLARLPKKRIGQPKDIGAAAVFLASSEADYVTGIVLYVDGGWLTG